MASVVFPSALLEGQEHAARARQRVASHGPNAILACMSERASTAAGWVVQVMTQGSNPEAAPLFTEEGRTATSGAAFCLSTRGDRDPGAADRPFLYRRSNSRQRSRLVTRQLA